ncbi:hypothetical protein HPP92_023658 [Vanilla planifolia]|uniref:Uncharacterized protein n=1 Tax=Vanilla planifolia TaxID=51239 RepID=A0A835PL03_VANPL|nr:hypothetical protein HPP92_023658 [Vanilla planifolia]
MPNFHYGIFGLYHTDRAPSPLPISLSTLTTASLPHLIVTFAVAPINAPYKRGVEASSSFDVSTRGYLSHMEAFNELFNKLSRVYPAMSSICFWVYKYSKLLPRVSRQERGFEELIWAKETDVGSGCGFGHSGFCSARPESQTSTTLVHGHHRSRFDGGWTSKNHQPTGRFCNGKLAADITAETLGFTTYPPAYLSPQASGKNLLIGANFASAASGYYDDTAIMYTSSSDKISDASESDVRLYQQEMGFFEARKGCCGTGTVETALLCNPKSIGTCANATGDVVWDSVHPSEAANKVLADSLIIAGIGLIG